MEIPFLRFSTISNLNHHVSVVYQIEVSCTWKLRDNIEVSFDIKTKSFVELSFLWFALPLINVHNIPLLVDLSVGTVNSDVLVFSVNSSLDLYNFIVLDVSNESTIKSK